MRSEVKIVAKQGFVGSIVEYVDSYYRCAGSSDCSRSRPRSRSASASTSPRCSCRCRVAARTAAGVAVYRDPAPSGWSKLTLYSADPHEHWGAVMDGLRDAFGGCDEPSIRASHAVFVVDADAAEAEAGSAANRPDLRVMSAGQVIEIYKEIGLPEEFAAAVPPRGLQGHTRARPHADGDREPGDDRGLASVLDRARPLPRPQRLALEPQPPAREPPARGDRVPDRERHRGRGRLPRLAAARGRDARAGARGLPRRPRRLLHLRRRDRGRVRRPARPDRLQAGRARGDGRLGGDGLRVARDRRPPRRRRRAGLGARSPESSTSGRRRRSPEWPLPR